MPNSSVVILCGAPGTGKSTWGEKFAQENGYTYLSSDRNRARVGRGEDDLQASARAFALLKKELKEALERGENVVVDATFMYKKARKDFVNIARNQHAYLRAVTFEIDRKTILERNAFRASKGGRNVPTFVIDNMLSKYEKPEFPEFDEVTVINK